MQDRNDFNRVRKAQKKDIADIKKITDECTGVGYYSEEDIENIIEKKGHDIFLCLDENGDAIAYMYACVEEYREVKRLLHIKSGECEIDGVSDKTVFGVIKTACTSEKYRKNGIYTMFVKKLENVFRSEGAEYSIVSAHRYPDGTIPIDKVMCSLGFEPVARLKHPWIDMYFYCNYCGKYHCDCDAVIYIKELA